MMQLHIGVDLGGTNCRLGLVSPGGEVLDSRRFPTAEAHQQWPQLARLLVQNANTLKQIAQSTYQARVASMGVGVPGLITPQGQVRVSPNMPWLDGCRMARELEQQLAMPVTVVNDANAIAWGEYRFGGIHQVTSMLVFVLGTGVGGGLILNDSLWLGADGSAGELGHIMVEPQGRPCGCGSRGCLEQYASATGIVLTARELWRQGRATAMSSYAPEEWTSVLLAEGAKQGDALAQAAFAEAGRRLGQALASLVNVLNIEAAVFAGGATGGWQWLAPALQHELAQRAFAVPAQRLALQVSCLPDTAGLLGSAQLAAESGP